MKLNIGCGMDYKKGYVNCDIRTDIKTDRLVDLNQPLPFKDDSIDEIYCNGVLLYIPDLNRLFRQFNRICKSNAKIIINESHYTNPYANSDYHKLHNFGYWSFATFTMLEGKEDIQTIQKISTRLIFPKGKMFWNYLLEPIFNLLPVLYEYVFAGLIKCWSVKYELIVSSSKKPLGSKEK